MNKVQSRRYTISQLDINSASQIARLHQMMLPDDVLPALGYKFLCIYYEEMLCLDSQAVLGVVVDGELVGFCQLSLLPVSILHTMLARPVNLLALCWLGLTKPKLFLRGLWASLVPERAPDGKAEITFIAVDAGWQGKGIGKLLIAEATSIAHNHGKVTVITKTGNERAKLIYEETFGARVVSERMMLGKRYWYLSWTTGNRNEGMTA